jgi:hypothetical protein
MTNRRRSFSTHMTTLMPLFAGAILWVSYAQIPAMGSSSAQESATYADHLAEGHDCWRSGRHDLPNAAVVTFARDVAPRYVTNPHQVDAAFRAALGEKVPSIDSVSYLCLD